VTPPDQTERSLKYCRCYDAQGTQNLPPIAIGAEIADLHSEIIKVRVSLPPVNPQRSEALTAKSEILNKE